MKAMIHTKYGPPDVLELRDVEKPVPKNEEVLVRVHAASINDWDLGLLRGKPFVNRMLYGVRKPKVQILGCDIAGQVEAVGTNVRRLQPGDEVFGDLCQCGFGGFAEYACAREGALELKPAAMTFEEAAAIPQAAMQALQGLRDEGEIRSGQRLLINGAGGGVGTFGVQLAKLHGIEVTGVDSSGKLDMLRSLGFDHVIDYAQVDFTQTGQRYDLILDVKTNRPISHYARTLSLNGRYVTVGGSTARLMQAVIQGPWISITRKRRIRVVALKPNKDLAYINELFEAGKFKPVIDGPYPLSDLPEALRYFGTGDHKGKVVISVRV